MIGRAARNHMVQNHATPVTPHDQISRAGLSSPIVHAVTNIFELTFLNQQAQNAKW